MSRTTLDGPTDRVRQQAPTDGWLAGVRRQVGSSDLALAAVLLLVGGLCPFFLEAPSLQVGMLAFGAVVAAMGLDLLAGVGGQLSLAPSFFLAVGAFGYAVLAGPTDSPDLIGFGLPTLLAAVLAVVLAGLSGLAFSPVAGRLHGLYLAVASIGLVFLGEWFLNNGRSVTGGFNGRTVEPLQVLGVTFGRADPVVVLGVEFARLQKLWYVGLVVAVVALIIARRLRDGRPGRALRMLRENPDAAAVYGVRLARARATAFLVSSVYAGAGGVLIALTVQRIVPSQFSLQLSILYVAMLMIGGLGTVTGAAAGAVVVTVLPPLLQRYGDLLSFTSGVNASVATARLAQVIFGTVVVLVILFRPDGLRGLAAQLRRRLQRRKTMRAATANVEG